MIITLHDARKKRKVTQVKLSEMTGISQAMISRFESGDSMPSVAQICIFMKALGCDWYDLVDA